MNKLGLTAFGRYIKLNKPVYEVDVDFKKWGIPLSIIFIISIISVCGLYSMFGFVAMIIGEALFILGGFFGRLFERK